MLLCFAIAIGMVMNVRIFLGYFEFNGNGADIPMAILGLSALISWRLLILRANIWRVPAMRFGLVMMGICLALAFWHGYSQYGFVKWAFFARFLGLLVCFGFFLSGIMVRQIFGYKGLRKMVYTTCFAIIFAIIFEFILKKTHQSWFQYPADSFRFYGLLLNPNAYSFFILINGVVLAYLHKKINLLAVFCGSWLGLGMIITTSATGWVVLALLSIGLIFIRPRFMLASFIGTILLFGAIYGLELIINYFTDWQEIIIMLGTEMQHGFTEVNEERASLFWNGLDLWQEYPYFGAGLGAFIAREYQQYGEYHTIHNGFIWLGAELGIIGGLVFLSPAWQVVMSFFTQKKWRRFSHDFLAMALLLAIALFSMPHDMFFQRIFWFYWGFLMVRQCPPSQIPKLWR